MDSPVAVQTPKRVEDMTFEEYQEYLHNIRALRKPRPSADKRSELYKGALRGGYGLYGGAGDVAYTAGSMLGSEGIKDVGRGIKEHAEQLAATAPPKVASLSEAYNTGNLVDYLSGSVPAGVVSMLPYLVAGATGNPLPVMALGAVQGGAATYTDLNRSAEQLEAQAQQEQDVAAKQEMLRQAEVNRRNSPLAGAASAAVGGLAMSPAVSAIMKPAGEVGAMFREAVLKNPTKQGMVTNALSQLRRGAAEAAAPMVGLTAADAVIHESATKDQLGAIPSDIVSQMAETAVNMGIIGAGSRAAHAIIGMDQPVKKDFNFGLPPAQQKYVVGLIQRLEKQKQIPRDEFDVTKNKINTILSQNQYSPLAIDKIKLYLSEIEPKVQSPVIPQIQGQQISGQQQPVSMQPLPQPVATNWQASTQAHNPPQVQPATIPPSPTWQSASLPTQAHIPPVHPYPPMHSNPPATPAGTIIPTWQSASLPAHPYLQQPTPVATTAAQFNLSQPTPPQHNLLFDGKAPLVSSTTQIPIVHNQQPSPSSLKAELPVPSSAWESVKDMITYRQTPVPVSQWQSAPVITPPTPTPASAATPTLTPPEPVLQRV